MEKLQPVVKQKFWILLGVGIVMTITGWWMATGTMASTTNTRRTEVENAFKKIPSGEIPNTDWSTQLAARNVEQDRAIKYTAYGLWERQKSRMTWPETVAEFAWTNGYRGDIALSGRENYRQAYGYDVRRVWESVRPFNQLDGTGVVVYGQNERILPQVMFGNLAPLAPAMWDAQEDLWLLESLLQAIVRVNGGPNGERGDAYVHVIENLKLCGGVPAAQRKATSGSSGTSGMSTGPGGAHGSGSAASMTFGGTGAGEMGMGGMGGRMGGQSSLASADFNPSDEFGDDGSSKTFGTMGGGGGGGAASMGPASGGAHGGGGGAGGALGSTTAASNVRRYIDDDAALPYKTRGFYLSVIMDHRKIPSLIAELSASEASVWPVEIVRVQMVRLHDDDVNTNSNTGFGMSGLTGNRSTPMSPLSIGGGASNIAGSADGEAFTRPPLIDPTRDAAAANPNSLQAAATAAAQLDNALQDPFMARVALCGIITLYKEVKPDPAIQTPVAAPAAAPPPTPAAAAPAEEPDSAKPAAESTTPETPADDKAPAENKTPAADKSEDMPAEVKPSDPAAPAEANPPKKPEGAEAAPKEPASPGK